MPQIYDYTVQVRLRTDYGPEKIHEVIEKLSKIPLAQEDCKKFQITNLSIEKQYTFCKKASYI